MIPFTGGYHRNIQKTVYVSGPLLSEKDDRKASWYITGRREYGTLCRYYRNIENGVDCTAKNCCCELYEADL